MNDIRNRVESAIEKITGHGDTAYLDQQLEELDSLDQVELACHLEEEFGVKIPEDAELTKFTSVESICEYIESLVAKEV